MQKQKIQKFKLKNAKIIPLQPALNLYLAQESNNIYIFNRWMQPYYELNGLICKNEQQQQKRQQQLFIKYGIKMLPVRIQVGQVVKTTIPQYSDTEMSLIQCLVRSLFQQIPDKQKLNIVNWTKGPFIGKCINPDQTLQSLLQDSQQKIPTIRVYYENCEKYKVVVDVHDIIMLTYNQVGRFNYMADLINFVSNDLRKQLKLSKKTKFTLKLTDQLEKINILSFIGRYFNVNKTNTVKMMVQFQEDISREFVKQNNNDKYEHLVCPISQLIMQQPVTTSCKHIFDKLCISLAIMKDNKCPVCRHHLEKNDIKIDRKLKRQIGKLKQLQIMERIKESAKKQEQSQKQQSN